MTRVFGWLRTAWEFARDSYVEFTDDEGARLSAGMAYYVLFVMAPIGIILTSVGARFGTGSIDGPFMTGLAEVLGEDLATYFFGVLYITAQARSSVYVGVVGAVLLVWALGVFYINTQSVFNRMWRVAPRRGLAPRQLVRIRARRFAVMLVPVGLLGVGTLVSAMATVLGRVFNAPVYDTVVALFSSPFVVTLVAWLSFAVLYKFLPDAYVPWRPVIIATFIIALGWTFGTYVFGLYLSWGAGASAYGAAGAIFVLLIWVNYSARLVMVGCKMTKRWTERGGQSVTPLPHATLVRVEVEVPVE